ncbi:hypothetical protein DJ021_03035 [Phenylobacterium hankyongense]|uniref:Uncharacterized protein n=1 Tax=Phenylobacterium hankyongense TaxID=1813876 RepID=A0A328AX77_9CAUL|nr:hypothetical protein DJ021_03035 [Phenylobacterium hankyongense]
MLAAMSAGPALAAAPRPESPAWVITPAEDSCHTEIELVGRSGQTAQVTLTSDGQQLALVFAKDDLPARAFLTLRVDQKPYANLVVRKANPKLADMVLSEETQAALRRGSNLQISWLTQEPVSAALGGSEQGLADLRTCGAQVATQHRAQLAQAQEARARADADARAQALADAQLAAAKAQAAAATAEAERQRAAQQAAEDSQAQAQAEARAVAQAQAQAEYEARDYRREPPPQSAPPQYAPWGYDRYYDPGPRTPW